MGLSVVIPCRAPRLPAEKLVGGESPLWTDTAVSCQGQSFRSGSDIHRPSTPDVQGCRSAQLWASSGMNILTYLLASWRWCWLVHGVVLKEAGMGHTPRLMAESTLLSYGPHCVRQESSKVFWTRFLNVLQSSEKPADDNRVSPQLCCLLLCIFFLLSCVCEFVALSLILYRPSCSVTVLPSSLIQDSACLPLFQYLSSFTFYFPVVWVLSPSF